MSDLRATVAILDMAILRWYRAVNVRKWASQQQLIDADAELEAAENELEKLGAGIEAMRVEQGLDR